MSSDLYFLSSEAEVLGSEVKVSSSGVDGCRFELKLIRDRNLSVLVGQPA